MSARGRGRQAGHAVVAFVVALVACVALAVVEQAAAAQRLGDALARAPEHVGDLARGEARQRMEDDLSALLSKHAVEKHHVQVRVELEVRGGALHDDHRAALP